LQKKRLHDLPHERIKNACGVLKSLKNETKEQYHLTFAPRGRVSKKIIYKKAGIKKPLKGLVLQGEGEAFKKRYRSAAWG
jgi:hypothetical protein